MAEMVILCGFAGVRRVGGGLVRPITGPIIAADHATARL